MPIWVIVVTLIVWVSGMISARRRHTSWKNQLLFTIVCWGGFLLGFIPSRAVPQALLRTKMGRLATLSVLIGLPSLGFLASRKYLACACYVGGAILMYFSFFAGLLLFYPLFAAAVLMIAISFFLAFVTQSWAGSSHIES